MAGVCERAGSSIGALYARIPNKAALVRAVQLRALDRQLTAFEELVAHGPESAASLAEIIDELTMHVTAVLPREVGGLVRAIMIQGTRDPVMRQRVSFVWDEVTRLLADVLRRRADEHRHPQPDLAAEMIVRTLNGLLLQVVVFERPSDERLPAELRTLFFRYLGMAEGRGG
jgi:AcrR family transcriptional regulator